MSQCNNTQPHWPIVQQRLSTPDQAKRIAEMADGVIVGSAVVKVLEQSFGRTTGADSVLNVISLVRALKEAVG